MVDENSTQKPLKMYNRLFFKIYLYFGIILTFFAIMLGIIFMKLYTDSSMDNYRVQLKNEGEKVAKRVAEFVKEDNFDGFGSYIEILAEQATHDIWIISNPNAETPMPMKNAKLEDLDIEHNEIKKACQNAFLGKTDYRTAKAYSELYDDVMITVGVPVIDMNQKVIGAIVVSAPVEGHTDLIRISKSLVIVSAIVALIISCIIAFVFARKLATPISKMRVTAVQLAAGKFHTKTGIMRKDELGQLANTIDILSEKLGENEEERKYLDQMRLDFFANVSHELRTPITVVRAYMETLVDGVVTEPEKVNQYYERVLKECKSMERLVGDLLILSKMQNPDFQIEAEPVNLVQVFEDIIRSAKAISSKKNIKIEITKDSQEIMLMGDYDRLRQMFLVILDNAIKFSDMDSYLYINLSSKDKLRVSIKDCGIGISEEELPNIFDKFYKSKLRQNAQGSGLGLAIAKQIALKHNGTIEVRSELNKGTEFIFEFDKNVEL